MIQIKHSDGVYEIEDFLTDEESKILLMSSHPDGFVKFHTGNIVKNLLEDSLLVVPGISNRIMSCFEKAHSHTNITNIRRLKEGEFMSSHVDGGYPDSKEKIVFGIAIYLNDDFEGGYLDYPDLGISVKPKKNSMVIHDSKLLHKVLPVLSGNRYSITTFIFGDEGTRIKDNVQHESNNIQLFP